MSRARLVPIACALLALTGVGYAAQYNNPNGSVSPGYVPEIARKEVTDSNPLPVKVIGGGSGGGGGGDASAANQQAEIASLGTDGTSPPTTAGTGIRGWLRAIYEKLTGTLTVSATSLPLPAGAATETTQQGVASSSSAINTATGAKTDAATASGADTSIIGALRAIRDRLFGTLTVSGTVTANLGTLNGAATAAGQASPQTAGSAATGTGTRVMGNDGAAMRDIRTTTTGALEPPTAASGKITVTSTALSANASTTIAAANANRIALGIQCASGGVSISEAGVALTAAGVGSGSLFIPAGTGPYFNPPVATLTAVTAYTATAQTCAVTEYLR